MHIGIGMGMTTLRVAGTTATVPGTMSAPAVAQIDQTRLSVTRAAAPGNGGSPILSYDLRSSVDQVTWTVVSGIAAVQTITGLAAGTLYFVQTRAVNAVGPAPWSASASQSTVAASPVNSVLPVISGTATQGQTLSVTNGTWSNSPTGFTYQWKRAGTVISGATAASYLLVNADVGTTITCTVTASNAGGSGTATSAATSSILPLAPVNTVLPVISGTATQGQTLSVTNGTWSNNPTGFAYQWKRAGTVISGATAASYLLVNADAGSTITCTVTASNAGGANSATSTATGTVLPLAPVNSAVPVISGTVTQGQTLSVTNGTWTNNPTGFIYQWKSGGVAISGAVAASYALQAADVGTVITCTVTASNAGGSASATSAATSAVAQSLTTLPTTPAARWHPAFSSVTASGGRVVSATDLQALADVSEGSSGLGPLTVTDALGRKAWRFNSFEWLKIAAGLTLNKTGVAVFFVGRMHIASGTNRIISSGVNGTTAVNTGGAIMEMSGTLSGAVNIGAPFIKTCGKSGSLGTAPQKFVAGAQLHVSGVCGRLAANSGSRILLNEYAENVTANTATAGGEIGRYAFSPSASGSWGQFDLYELVVYTGILTDAQADAIQAALVANYAIVATVNQLVLDGDSISAAVDPPVPSGNNPAMVITEPGAGRIPANYRVVNMSHPGDAVNSAVQAAPKNLVARRDQADGWPAYKLSGKNYLSFQIGRNDFAIDVTSPTDAAAEAQHRANVLAYLNTATTGVLQRGWSVRAQANIGCSTVNNMMAKMVLYRADLRSAQWQIDLGTNAGGAFDGKFTLIPTDLITVSGATVFSTTVDANNTTYYKGDLTHPNLLGTFVMATGGDDPTMAIAYGLTA